MSLTKSLKDQNLIQPPKWLTSNIILEARMGSFAYGVNNESSDVDLVGLCFPPKEYIFPHLAGYVPGFGPKPPSFEHFNQAHI